jgi:hypothetical protein
MNYDLEKQCQGFSFEDPLKNKLFKTAKSTLFIMIANSDDFGVTYISIRTLAQKSGKSSNSILSHIKILEDLGIVANLNINGSFGKSSYRKIHFNVQPNVQVDVQPNVSVDVQVDVQPNVSVDVQVAETKYNTIEYNRMELDKNSANASSTHPKKKKHTDKIEEYIEDNYNDEATPYCYDFLEYRKELGKPIKTSQAIVMYMNELNRLYTKGGVVLVDKEIERMKGHEWQTIYAEDKQHKSKRG